jgi:hypothetical protein
MSLRDRIMARSSLRGLKAPAFLLLDGLQRTEDPATQLDALSLTFTAICQSAGLDPHELIIRSRRQLREADLTRNPEIEAIRDYAAGELA